MEEWCQQFSRQCTKMILAQLNRMSDIKENKESKKLKDEYLLEYYSTQKWWDLFSKYCIYHTYFLDHQFLLKWFY